MLFFSQLYLVLDLSRWGAYKKKEKTDFLGEMQHGRAEARAGTVSAGRAGRRPLPVPPSSAAGIPPWVLHTQRTRHWEAEGDRQPTGNLRVRERHTAEFLWSRIGQIHCGEARNPKTPTRADRRVGLLSQRAGKGRPSWAETSRQNCTQHPRKMAVEGR